MIYKRQAIVAGSFYDMNKESLLKQLKNCFLHEIGPQKIPKFNKISLKRERNIMSVISPHAGYVFSGPVAAHHFFELSKEETPETVIIIGPNHRGFGADIAIMDKGYWETPLGVIEIDEKIATDIIKNDNKHIIQVNTKAHQYEHSIEVQLPFLQYIYFSDSFKILPICIANQDYETIKELSNIIYKSTLNNSILLIASTDFTHYENQEAVSRKDSEYINDILNMDTDMFYKTIMQNNASVCGYGAIGIVMEYSKKINTCKGKLLKYATSGDVSGITDQVVGYASIVFEKEFSGEKIQKSEI